MMSQLGNHRNDITHQPSIIIVLINGCYFLDDKPSGCGWITLNTLEWLYTIGLFMINLSVNIGQYASTMEFWGYIDALSSRFDLELICTACTAICCLSPSNLSVFPDGVANCFYYP